MYAHVVCMLSIESLMFLRSNTSGRAGEEGEQGIEDLLSEIREIEHTM